MKGLAMGNVFTSVVRTLVPVIVGGVIAFGLWAGLDLDGESVAIAVTSTVTAVYYTVFRILEGWAEKIGNPRLRRIAGWLLGLARPPQYPKDKEVITG